MPGSYPFIDIAALDSIREGFVRGDAQIVLSRDLSEVLWVNGAGARLFGFDRVEDMIGGGLDLAVATRRQIAAAGDGTVSVRLGGGLARLTVSHIDLPDHVPGLLLASESGERDPAAAIAGLGDDSTHVALLGAGGTVIAASPRFANLDIAPATLDDLAVEAADAPDRLVKRRIRAGGRSLPGAVARLADTPPAYLVCMVGEAPAKQAPEKAAEPDPAPKAQQAPESEQQPRGFVFDRAAPPARFIWKTDADTVFTEISPELAAAVGPHAADVVGRRFADAAQALGLDPDGTVAALMSGRGTWSGRRIMWPVEGTGLRVPGELAALPACSRDRAFTGFRGFGIVRPAEAVEDDTAKTTEQTAAESADATPDVDDPALALTEEIANDDRPDRVVPVLPKPPLDIAPTPGRRESDKVIGLLDACAREKIAADQAKFLKAKERETRPEGGLTSAERNAFREIAERLRTQGLGKQGIGNGKDTAAETAETAPKAEIAAPEAAGTAPAEKTPATSEPSGETVAEPAGETALLASLPVPVIIHSGGEVHYVNPALLALTGHETLDEIRAGGGVEALFNSESDGAADGRRGMVLRRADGGEVPVDAHLNAVAWRGGRALMLSLMPEEAGHAVSAEPARPDAADAQDDEKQALEAHIDELKTILDTATDGVVMIDPDGRIRSMNHSAAALFGYDRAETEGKSFAMLFAIESQRAAMDYLAGLSGNGVLSVLNDGREVIGREAKGGFIPLFMTIGRLPQQRGFCAVLRDLTQWKRTEEELTNARKEAERASSQKTDFLARISHEIRTPLNAIIGFSELMADEKFGPIGNDRYKDYLRDINRSGTHVLALVNDLLDISKIEAGALDLQFEAVSLNDAVAEAIALMQPQANRERVIIRSSFQSSLPDVVADARSIKQVALNLLSNAVRFTAPGGQVIVSTSYEMNGDVALRVRDTGIGMTRAEVEQALKPFRQVEAARRRDESREGGRDWRSQGTGLGLPLTKTMVEANRAQFAIDSTPGRGTVVEILFPPTRVLAD